MKVADVKLWACIGGDCTADEAKGAFAGRAPLPSGPGQDAAVSRCGEGLSITVLRWLLRPVGVIVTGSQKGEAGHRLVNLVVCREPGTPR